MAGKGLRLNKEKVKALGKEFERARIQTKDSAGNSYDDRIYDFAGSLDMHGSHLGRLEKGKVFPGPDVMRKMYRVIRATGKSPKHVILLWLEAQGLDDYVFDLTKGGG